MSCVFSHSPKNAYALNNFVNEDALDYLYSILFKRYILELQLHIVLSLSSFSLIEPEIVGGGMN